MVCHITERQTIASQGFNRLRNSNPRYSRAPICTGNSVWESREATVHQEIIPNGIFLGLVGSYGKTVSPTTPKISQQRQIIETAACEGDWSVVGRRIENVVLHLMQLKRRTTGVLACLCARLWIEGPNDLTAANPARLNEPVDVSGAPYNVAGLYYRAGCLPDLDPAAGKGNITYQHYAYFIVYHLRPAAPICRFPLCLLHQPPTARNSASVLACRSRSPVFAKGCTSERAITSF